MSRPEDLIVRCPRCRQRGFWFREKWAPFCSERCRLIDLGQWFNEEHKFTRELRPGDFDAFDDLEAGMNPDRPPPEPGNGN